MLTACQECSNQISDQSPSCPQCGSPNPHYKKPMGGVAKFLIASLVAIVVAIAGLMIIGSDPDVRQQTREREAWELCQQTAQQQLSDVESTCGPRP